jgi:Zn-finger nucleic acid-binding protein
MLCPSCDYQLQKLSVTTTSGGKFEVDHCGRCGGTWFDPYEINRIPYHEVLHLASLVVLPQNQPVSLNPHKCPRCHKILEKYSGESVPRHVSLFRCPQCRGIWTTQKALEAFKNHQEEVIKEYKTSKVAFPHLSVVFVPAIFIALLFISTFITLNSLQETKEERIQATALISEIRALPISPTTVSLTFETKVKTKSMIAYGVSTLQFATKTVSSTPTLSHRLLLTDLTPNTVYFFQITLTDLTDKKYTTPFQTFITKL